MEIVPAQEYAAGVIVMVDVIGADVAFVAVNAGTLPVPDSVRPIELLLFVQLNVVPATAPESVVEATETPLQKV